MNRTKDKLADSLTELLKTRSLHDITVRDITDAAGITRQAFYRYFHTRNDLICWVYDQNFAEYFPRSGEVAWKDMIIQMMMALNTEKDLFCRLVRQSEDDTLQQIMEDYTVWLYTRIIRCNTGAEPDTEMQQLLRMYSCGGVRMAVQWVRSGMKQSPESMQDLFYKAMPPRLASALTASPVPVEIIFRQH